MPTKKTSAKKKPPTRIGRPLTYSEKFHPMLARALAMRGLTDVQMAAEMGITSSTFYKWKKERPAFSEALKEAKEGPDDAVERTLFEKALGYVDDETKVHFDKNGDVHTFNVQRKIAPSDTAMIFWLKNRRPDKWRDKQEIEHSGGVVFNAPNALDD